MKLHLQILGSLFFVVHCHGGIKGENNLTRINLQKTIESVSKQSIKSQLNYIQQQDQQVAENQKLQDFLAGNRSIKNNNQKTLKPQFNQSSVFQFS